MSMIKAFAPVLGEFQGEGRLADGTDVIGVLEAREALENVAYSFRANMTAQDNGACVLDAFFVLSNTENGGLELQFYDTREHIHKLTWTGAGRGDRDISRHVFPFEGKRDNGANVRISFELTSAEKCNIRYETSGNGAQSGQWRELWSLDLDRRHALVERKAA